ncbi:hypothetical protein [Alysiella filiformis]|uniref:Threonine dehydratase n=1 Tax=Alysiella filiformis DSM 16848 TaxID=1120981 RepID=A0A286EEB6_9NEIS|nr:hypothetical protein [Alysiella filiformis]QMT31608.1 hypothetical protein H3L97_01465 [Alysiella filiformis]UBQ55381.1 hypothetical protein JF568_07210 [Alysiella filiformis DSM 16848]SOD69247.1 hypothetical protein SAMN02746062_01582 [Alysiella filiformis DSM 16848]
MTCKTHEHHDHQHGANCGHTAIKHGDHIDYLHDGHLHHEHNGHYDEHALDVNETNPAECNAAHHCGDHVHGEGCGHEAVPHGDHIDYIVNGRLHHQHGDHCDDHGPVEIVK